MTDKSRLYWAATTSSTHRSTRSKFYSENADEHISIISDEDRRLQSIDLGCGAGKLLYHYIKRINVSTALDYSEAMLAEAKQIINGKIDFVCADIYDFLPNTKIPVWLTTEALNQYLDKDQIRQLIRVFSNNINARSFYLFETICPLRFDLMNLGLSYRPEHLTNKTATGTMKNLINRLRYAINLISGKYTADSVYLGKPMLGYSFLPKFWLLLAKEYGLNIEILGSKYYEYRYHVILKKDN